MRKIILFFFAFLLSLNTLAYDPPYDLPYTENGITYDKFVEMTFSNGDQMQYYWGGYTNYTPSDIRNPYQGGGNDLNFSGQHSISRHKSNGGSWGSWSSDSGTFGFNGLYPLSTAIGNGNIHSSVDIVKGGGTSGSYAYSCGVNNVNGCDVLMYADVPHAATTLTLAVDPSAGGTVASFPEGIDCPDNQCEGSLYGGVILVPSASSGFAFGYWDDGTMNSTSDPLTMTVNGDKVLLAKFFRTFRNAVGDFQITTGDECVIYVRNETGIPYNACHGEAADCFDQAQSAGYATGSDPVEGAIIVFDRVPNTALDVGHVGIVTGYNGNSISIHDSNWVGGAGNHIIGDHTEIVGSGGYAIRGYIYHAP